MKSLEYLAEDGLLLEIFVSKLKLHETISALIHINCNPDLNCA